MNNLERSRLLLEMLFDAYFKQFEKTEMTLEEIGSEPINIDGDEI